MSLTLESVVNEVTAAEAAPAPSPEPTGASVPDAPAPDPAPSADPAPAPSAFSVPDDAIVTVTIDGKDVPMPWKDARRNISAHQASTQRFMAAAEAKKVAEQARLEADTLRAELAAREARLAAVMNDPQQLAALYMAVESQKRGTAAAAAQPSQPFDPNTFVRSVMEKTDQIVAERLQAKMEEMREAETIAATQRDFQTYTDSLIADTPALKVVPGFADHVFAKVAQMGPESVEQAKEWIAAEVAEIKAQLTTTLTESQKAAAVAKAKAATGTERGGSAPMPSPTQYSGVGDPALEADMARFLADLR